MSNSTTDKLERMKREGSSVILNWGEDTDMWECSWITGGVRFTAFSTDLNRALEDCYMKMVKARVHSLDCPCELCDSQRPGYQSIGDMVFGSGS